ncbi:hypothetical protein PVK06_038212 [Gossypium arboreum]|uniref:RNase H type-1 domain-containing protein n=1 Tax=Gossypium arboreum TaxID=29729 RepID=A0ABR0MZH4_GOSAR|nr:hypothetical protein PVK06_038212 [Gossypium arboreum]
MSTETRCKFSSSYLTNDWVTLSKDGSIQKEVGFAAVGGIVQDQGGTWILGFNRYLGIFFVFYAESWGILDGLIILSERGYDNVLIQSDYLEPVTTIQERSSEGSNYTLVRRIY